MKQGNKNRVSRKIEEKKAMKKQQKNKVEPQESMKDETAMGNNKKSKLETQILKEKTVVIKQQQNNVKPQALKKGETMRITKYIGLDTHKDFITVAVADAAGGPVRYHGRIENTPASSE